MTPPNQQSDVDKAIDIIEIGQHVIERELNKSMSDAISTLITEIHRLRLDRGIAVDVVKELDKFFAGGFFDKHTRNGLLSEWDKEYIRRIRALRTAYNFAKNVEV